MFSLAHFFLRCCHTFFTSALGLLPWTSTLQELCKSEKFWKFQVLFKFKFILNIIFLEKIWKNQKKSENFRFSKKNEKFWKFQIFRKMWKIQKIFWKFQIFRKNLKKNKKSENFKFSEKIWKSDFQKKSENFTFSEKKWKIQRKSENFRFSEKKSEKFRK